MTSSNNIVNQMPLKRGDTLLNGKYEIISNTFNKGGFGRIYRAYDRECERRTMNGKHHIVAIKEFCIQKNHAPYATCSSIGVYTLNEENLRLELLRDQFFKEADILYLLHEQRDHHVPWAHKQAKGNIVFEDKGRLFYAMTYIDGITLAKYVNVRRTLPERMALEYIVQIGKFLYKAHEWHVVHCDISPYNIMVKGGHAILVDFGNARSYESLLVNNNMDASRRLASSSFGTRGFCNDKLTGTIQGDIFSLAATLYFILVGTPPGLCYSEEGRNCLIETLGKQGVSDLTTAAIVHALTLEPCFGSYFEPWQDVNAKTFLKKLPQDIVFETLLNYNDRL